MNFFKFFKRRHPYAPVAFLGRKNVQKMLGADITKLKNINKESSDEEDVKTLEDKVIAKQAKKAAKAKGKDSVASDKKAAKKTSKKTTKAKDKDKAKPAKNTAKAKGKDDAKPAKKIVKAIDKDEVKPVKKTKKLK